MFAYLILAGVERFLVEFIRTNPTVAGGLTQQQWISIALFIIGIAGTWWFARHGRLRPVAGEKSPALKAVSAPTPRKAGGR